MSETKKNSNLRQGLKKDNRPILIHILIMICNFRKNSEKDERVNQAI